MLPVNTMTFGKSPRVSWEELPLWGQPAPGFDLWLCYCWICDLGHVPAPSQPQPSVAIKTTLTKGFQRLNEISYRKGLSRVQHVYCHQLPSFLLITPQDQSFPVQLCTVRFGSHSGEHPKPLRFPDNEVWTQRGGVMCLRCFSAGLAELALKPCLTASSFTQGRRRAQHSECVPGTPPEQSSPRLVLGLQFKK